MVDWFAGKRVRGTSSERSGFGTSLGGTGVGGWVELGRTTLGSPASSINVTSLTDKRYYMYLTSFDRAATLSAGVYLNSDTGSNFSFRYSTNGAADATGTSDNRMFISGNSLTGKPDFGVGYVANLSTKEKLAINHFIHQETAGAATAPSRWETAGKHAQTSNPVNAIGITGTNNFATGSEVVVLGWDPADSHTNNFWEELGSTTLGSSGDDLDITSFTSKKYLWVQAYMIATGGNIAPIMRFNNDSATNYAIRGTENGAADSTSTSRSNINLISADRDTPMFANMFIINNTSNEKLVICHTVKQYTAGSSTAPERYEVVGKWANTSNQISRIDINNPAAGSFDTGSIIKVWGAN